jgi:hypothetical protein
MSLDPSKLENARERGGKIVARCPACAELGHDEKGEHLVIMPDGRFGCVVNPGTSGKEHRKEIFALAGKGTRGSLHTRVRRPFSASLPKIAGRPIYLGRPGTLGTDVSNPRATRESSLGSGGDEEISAHARSAGVNASQASQPVAHDPLLARALERPRKIPHSPPKHPDIDLETGFPIIDGAICPF